VQAVPRRALQLRKKHGKTPVRVVVYILHTHTHTHTHIMKEYEATTVQDIPK